jgi:hypothetical protein
MCLSNLQLCLVVVIGGWATVSCGLFADTKTPIPAPAIVPNAEIPFEVREPEAYSAEIIMSGAGRQMRRSIYRSGNDWRMDIYEDTELSRSIVHAVKTTIIDPARKVYTEEVEGGPASETIQDITQQALSKRRYVDFEDLGFEGKLKKYRASIFGQEGGDVILYYDEALKMVTRQEYFEKPVSPEIGEPPIYIFELRNIRLEVPVSTFEIPAEFKKVSEREFYARESVPKK